MSIPVKFQFDWVKNLVSPTSCVPNGVANSQGQCIPGTSTISCQDSGYQIGGLIGRVRNAGSWESFYWYKWLQADATLSAFSDSDFGDGGNNR